MVDKILEKEKKKRITNNNVRKMSNVLYTIEQGKKRRGSLKKL